MGITNHLRQMHPEKYYANGNNTKLQLSCSQCNEKYYSRNNLKRHEYKVHGMVVEFQSVSGEIH